MTAMTATKPQVIDVKEAAKENDSFRKVLFTADKSQLVIMSIRIGEAIGREVHTVDQLIYIVDGEGVAVIDGRPEPFVKGAMLCIPAGATHDVVNIGDAPLKLFTVYAPPEHAPGTLQRTKAEAQAAEASEPAPA